MIEIVVIVVGLVSHSTRIIVPRVPTFSSGEACKMFIDENVNGAQRLANKLSRERTEVTLACRVRPYHEA